MICFKLYKVIKSRNRSSTKSWILDLSSFDCSWSQKKFHEDSFMRIHTQGINTCAHASLQLQLHKFFSSLCVDLLLVCALCAWIFTQKNLVIRYCLLSLSLKFHKDPWTRWGVINLFVTFYNFMLKLLL